MNKIKGVRGCKELQNYFTKHNVKNLSGGYVEFLYWQKKNGHWVYDKQNKVKNYIEVSSFEEYFKNETKIIKMENTLYQVDEKFIKEAHKAACDSWKLKIEEKFPKVFELGNIIGKTYVPCDNSYAVCLENGECSMKMISGGIFNKECIIISEPYKSKSLEKGYNLRPDNVYDFVNVLYKDHTYMVLFQESWIQK